MKSAASRWLHSPHHPCSPSSSPSSRLAPKKLTVPHPDMNSLYALPVFLDAMHPLMAALVTTSLVASVFVSVSTVALAIASLVVRDFYVPWKKPSPEQEFR